MNENDKESKDDLRELFDRFDTDASNRFNMVEFRKMLESLGHESIPEVLELEFASIDEDDDGSVTFDEFVAWWRDYQ